MKQIKVSRSKRQIKVGSLAIPVGEPSDNITNVMASSGKNAGAKVGVAKISDLFGMVRLNQPEERSKVESIKSKITSETGFISPIVVSAEGEVIEGQHRLVAMSELGATEMPVVVVYETADFVPDVQMLQEVLMQSGLRQDQVSQMTSIIGEILMDEDGNFSELEFYDAPQGFERAWKAGVEEVKRQLADGERTNNPRQSMMGININDCTQDFTGQILRGEKTIETRSTRSLDPYIGERVGIVRTGVGKATLVGYATVGEPVVYDSVAKFRRDYEKHLVAPGSAFDMKDRLKYGYPLMQVEEVEPRVIESRGIVARKVNPMTSDSEYLDAVSRGDMKTAQRMVDEAAKAAGYDIRGYHGTRSPVGFTKFTPNKALGGAIFVAVDPLEAKSFGRVMDVFIKAKNVRKGVVRSYDEVRAIDAAKQRGQDAIRVTDGPGAPINYAVFDPSQIKSADPVTYDDAGNVIPLSQRFNDQSDDIRNPYTRPDLRERLKRKIMAGSKGGNPGQWSARKAQLLAAEYEKAGGGYTGGRSKAQRSLSKWTKQDWRTKSGKPSLETGERYLPAAAIRALSSAEYAASTRAKREATGQFSRQPRRIAMKTKEFRNPKDPRSAMTQIATTVNTYRKASKMLGGRVLDYGAGYGLGTDAMREEGLLADSFEPYPEEWKGKRPPTYTDSADIPSESYDSLVSFSVVNVVDPDERKLLFQEVARILRPDGFALITGRTRQDVSAAKIKTPHLEEGGYLIGVGEEQRYQKGFTQAELERYAKEVLGPGFTVEANRALNGASIKITKGKTNPAKRDTVRSKLSRIIEPGDRILCYDTASGEDFYRLWDVIHTAMPMTKEALVEVEGMLDDDGVLVIESGESPAGLQDHFRKATRYQGLLLVQGPKNPEQARIETEKLRRELE